MNTLYIFWVFVVIFLWHLNFRTREVLSSLSAQRPPTRPRCLPTSPNVDREGCMEVRGDGVRYRTGEKRVREVEGPNQVRPTNFHIQTKLLTPKQCPGTQATSCYADVAYP